MIYHLPISVRIDWQIRGAFLPDSQTRRSAPLWERREQNKRAKNKKGDKMKMMTREEAIIAMLEGKEVTSDEMDEPDDTYCIYDSSMSYSPFRFKSNRGNTPIYHSLAHKTWRLRRYIPKDKELVWCWDDGEEDISTLCRYDAKNRCILGNYGNIDGIVFDHYAPYDGTTPPNIGVDSLKGLGVENEQS